MPGPWSLAGRRSPKIPRKGEGLRPRRPIIDTSQGLVAKALAAGSTPGKLATASTRSWHYRSGPVSPPGPLVFFGRATLTSMASRLEDQLKALPARPGVYLFRDRSGDVLYV